MAARPRDLEQCAIAYQFWLDNGRSYRKGAKALGWDRKTFTRHVEEFASHDASDLSPVKPGFKISKITNTPGGDIVQQKPDLGAPYKPIDALTLKGRTSWADVKPDGRRVVTREVLMERAGELDPIALAQKIEAVFAKMEPRPLVSAAPTNTDADSLTLYALSDMHLALYAWEGDAGGNWDMKIAGKVYREAMAQVAACSPPSSVGVVLGGGDYLHADTNDFRTQSGNVLDGDGRTDKVIDEAIQLAVFQVDLALEKHEKVVVRFLKGNHDQYASMAIVYALAAWYRNDPRVEVDKSPDLYWWFRFGKVLLGATHGHTVKVQEMPLIMANRRAKDWGETEHRFIHMFHIHHKTQYVFEGGGVIAESHQSPVVQDAYHHGRGYLSGRSMQSITYHKDRGEIVRNRVALG